MDNENLQNNFQENTPTNIKTPAPQTINHNKNKSLVVAIIVLAILLIAGFWFLGKQAEKKSDLRTITNEERLEILRKLDVSTEEDNANSLTQEQKVDFLNDLDKNTSKDQGPKISPEELEKILNATN